jgi:ribonuclease HI
MPIEMYWGFLRALRAGLHRWRAARGARAGGVRARSVGAPDASPPPAKLALTLEHPGNGGGAVTGGRGRGETGTCGEMDGGIVGAGRSSTVWPTSVQLSSTVARGCDVDGPGERVGAAARTRLTGGWSADSGGREREGEEVCWSGVPQQYTDESPKLLLTWLANSPSCESRRQQTWAAGARTWLAAPPARARGTEDGDDGHDTWSRRSAPGGKGDAPSSSRHTDAVVPTTAATIATASADCANTARSTATHVATDALHVAPTVAAAVASTVRLRGGGRNAGVEGGGAQRGQASLDRGSARGAREMQEEVHSPEVSERFMPPKDAVDIFGLEVVLEMTTSVMIVTVDGVDLFVIAESALLRGQGIRGELGIYALAEARSGQYLGQYWGERVAGGCGRDDPAIVTASEDRPWATMDLVLETAGEAGGDTPGGETHVLVDGSRAAAPHAVRWQLANDPYGTPYAANMRIDGRGRFWVVHGARIPALAPGRDPITSEFRWSYDAGLTSEDRAAGLGYWPALEQRWFEARGSPACPQRHALLRRRGGSDRISCDGCGVTWSRGGGWFWGCARCDFDLCDECVQSTGAMETHAGAPTDAMAEGGTDSAGGAVSVTTDGASTRLSGGGDERIALLLEAHSTAATELREALRGDGAARAEVRELGGWCPCDVGEAARLHALRLAAERRALAAAKQVQAARRKAFDTRAALRSVAADSGASSKKRERDEEEGQERRQASHEEVSGGAPADNDGGCSTPKARGAASSAPQLQRAALSSRQIVVGAWNAQRLTVNKIDDEAEGVSRDKLDWLDSTILADRPDILFLFEVEGTRASTARWRQAMGRRGFHVIFQGGGEQKRNAVVALVRKEIFKVRVAKAVATRVLGIEVEFVPDRRRRWRFVGMHGLNEETPSCTIDEDGVGTGRSFEVQRSRAQEWIEDDSAAGGLILGDMNRVLCESWRVAGGHRLTPDDRRMREMVGFKCACCWGSPEVTRSGGLVDSMDPTVTHFKTRTEKGVGGEKRRHWGDPSAKIDYAVAFGEEEGKWKPRAPQWAEDGRGAPVSDHAYMSYERTLLIGGHESIERRIKPCKIRADEQTLQEYRSRVSDETTAATQMLTAAETAVVEGEGGAGVAAAVLRGVAEEVLQEREEERGEVRRQALEGKTVEPPVKRREQWRERLTSALNARAQGVSPHDIRSGIFHERTGLRRYRTDEKGQPKEDEVVWRLVIRRCRREFTRALKAASEQERKEDAKLFARAAALLKIPPEKAAARLQAAWRMVAAKREAGELETIWKGDKAPPVGTSEEDATREGYVKMHAHDFGFVTELGNIGDAFVQKMQDTPACEKAFEAWCNIFMERYEEIQGIDGGVFELRKELTYEVFLEALNRMPNGKAVGAGGFSVELLKNAGESVKATFYKILMEDVAAGRVAESWRRVLYVLLKKPPPNNPDKVAERREIALMAQEMKLLMQMVREVSYRRILERVLENQAGWLAGFGCADTALVAACLIQQQRRLQQPLYLLYIDLSTFFPRCDRGVIKAAELLHGLPKEVVELTALIYGDGSSTDDAVRCQYDSAAGLGAVFKNNMGTLMGCVLSPDKAKLLLNTVVVAIQAVCKGVRLWGHGDADVEATWRHLIQVMFADDWVGGFLTLPDLLDCWEIWKTWAPIAGCKLGVVPREDGEGGKSTGRELKLKTAVTGVRWADGKAVTVDDPGLFTAKDERVPFIRHDEAYKHLGILRRADGSDDDAWKRLLRIFDVALARLRKLRGTTRREFIIVSNALLGGLAGYYLQTLYISFQQAEVIERKWRRIYRQKLGRKLGIATSTPRVYYYETVGGVGRQHLWSVGLTSLVTCMNNAVADAHPTPQRMAARSAIAHAMSRWGCRSDPNHWDWSHLTTDIETWLRKESCRDLGVAWMLGTAMLEGTHREMYDERKELGKVSMWEKLAGGDPAERRRAEAGRWEGVIEPGDPLHKDAAHLQRERSTLISEPVAARGLGMPAEPLLLGAGVTAIGHMGRRMIETTDENGRTTRSLQGDGWIDDYKLARRLHPRLPPHGAAEAAWKRQVARLRSGGVRAVGFTASQDRYGGSRGEKVTMERALAGTRRSDEGERRVDSSKMGDIRDALKSRASREVRTTRAWEASLRRALPEVARKPAETWNAGGGSAEEEACGARLVFDLCEEGGLAACGGEARWMRRREVGYVPEAPDAPVLDGENGGVEMLDDDGRCLSWEEREERMLRAVDVDESGHLVKGRSRDRLTEEEISRLPPALRAVAGAVAELKRRSEGKIEVTNDRTQPKRKATHINLATTREDLRRYCRVQAQYQINAFFAVDGSRTVVQDEFGNKEWVNARGAVRDDGTHFGGRLCENEGDNNYLDELAAQIDVLAQAPAGGRYAIVFDATSPVLAMRRFRRMCARQRQGYYVDTWLHTLLTLTRRHEVVVFMWRRSHTGSPFNELADVITDDYTKGGPRQLHREVPTYSSLRHTMCSAKVRAWARRTADRVVRDRLAGACTEAVVRDEGDITSDRMADDVYLTCNAILSQRSCMGDERKARLQRASDMRKRECPFCGPDEGGTTPLFTWHHAQYACIHEDLLKLRRDWLEDLQAVDEVCKQVDEVLLGLQLGFTINTITRCMECADTRADVPIRHDGYCALRRVAGGVFQSTSEFQVDRSKAMRETVHAATISGARLQQRAIELTSELEKELVEDARKVRSVKELAKRWRTKVVEGGPARAGALRAIDASRRRAMRIADEGRDAAQLVGKTYTDAVNEIRRRAANAGATARILHPQQGGRAYGQWRTIARLQNWRIRAMLHRGRGDWGTRRERGQGGELPRARRSARWAEDALASDWARAAVGGEMIPAGVRLTEQRPDPWGSTRSPWGVIEREAAANRKWLLGGGWGGEKKRGAERRAARAKASNAKAAAQFERYFCKADQRRGFAKGLSGKRRGTVMKLYDVEIGPRKRTRRKRGKVQSEAAGVRRGQKRRRERETSTWREGGWEAGEDYLVEEILDVRAATGQDVIDYADAADANVTLGSDMYLIKWQGWGPAYDSWEPYAFIADDGLIEAFRARVTAGLAGERVRRSRWPDSVVATRQVRLRPGCRPRLEALCRWQGAGEDGDDVDEWRRATTKDIGSRALRAAKALRPTADTPDDAPSGTNRVHPWRETRGAVKRKEAEGGTSSGAGALRRKVLRTIIEDDDDEE